MDLEDDRHVEHALGKARIKKQSEFPSDLVEGSRKRAKWSFHISKSNVII